MGTLGARGIGLSTLMSQGGTHAAGAIGFYLALRLVELAAVENYQLLVLPIDACDEFLRALAGGAASANQLRRADLLLLAVRPDEVVLVPVEIKSYGLESSQPPPNLPSSAGQLADPLGQLESTAALVQQLVGEYEQLQSATSEDAALWRHGFAAMVEAALRLHPGPDAGRQDLLKVLAGILEGTVSIRSGESLLAFFGHQATAPDGAQVLAVSDLPAPTDPQAPLTGALLANTQVAFQCATAGNGQVAQVWSRLVDWAITKGGHERVPDEHAPEQPGPDEHAPEQPEPDRPGPDEHAPEQPEPDQPGPDEHAPEQAEPDQPGPDEHAPEQPEPDQPGPDEHAPDRPGPDRPAFEEIEGDGVRFSLGTTLDGLSATEVDFWPSNTGLNQMNVGVVGDLGTGKTQFLKAMVRQLRHGASRSQPTPVSILIFDYKRDYQDDSFLADVGGSLLRPFHIPLDVLRSTATTPPRRPSRRQVHLLMCSPRFTRESVLFNATTFWSS